MRTLPVFFGVLDVLLRGGVTTVAEAAFQDHIWRPRLEPFRGLAQLRIVHCVVSDEVAYRRVMRRGHDNPLRGVHADPRPDDDPGDFARRRSARSTGSRWRHPGSRWTPPMAISPASATSCGSSTLPLSGRVRWSECDGADAMERMRWSGCDGADAMEPV